MLTINKDDAKRVVNVLGAEKLRNKDDFDTLINWLKTIQVDHIDINELALNFVKKILCEKVGAEHPDEDEENIHDWVDSINTDLYFDIDANVLCASYGEYRRIKNRKVVTKKNHQPTLIIKKQKIGSRFQGELGNINLNNINVKKVYINVDNFFAKNDRDDVIAIALGRQDFDIGTKNVASFVEDLIQVKVSKIWIPLPANITINNDDIIRLRIDEFSDLAYKEYPNINFMFQFRPEVISNKILLTPVNKKYKFSSIYPQLNNLTFSFWLQNLLLSFPPVAKIGTISFGSPTLITGLHGLVTGDKITVFNYNNARLNSTFLVTVINPNTFSILTTITSGYSQVYYFVQKNKISFDLELTCLS